MVSLIPTPFLALAAPSSFAVGAGTLDRVVKDVTTVRTSGSSQSDLNRHPCWKLVVCHLRNRRCRENVHSAIAFVREVISKECGFSANHDDGRGHFEFLKSL